MWIPLLLSLALAVPAVKPAGTIVGSITPPDKVKITKSVQVVVFSGDYVDSYLAEVQMRLDSYWEDYKVAFIQDKQAFLLFRELAERQAMELTLNRMRSQDPLEAANLVHTVSDNKFEFHSVPLGECKVVALVTINGQEFIWSQSVILSNDTPQFVALKPTSP